jgi:phosphopantothenoylcysteine synthetase/decarboxylase
MVLDSQLTEEQLFDQLISSLVHSAWVSLGKIKNPMNDTLEENLDQASIQIDMLDMLFKRMSGNLSENEEQYLGHIVRELKMNFVEEKNKSTENNMEDDEDKEKGKSKKKEDKDKEEVEKKTEESDKVEETDKENDEDKK